MNQRLRISITLNGTTVRANHRGDTASAVDTFTRLLTTAQKKQPVWHTGNPHKPGAPTSAQPLTPDEARAAVKFARSFSGPSDATQPYEYVIAGALAAVAKATQPSVPDGWKLIAVNERWDDFLAAIAIDADMGWLSEALGEVWNALDFESHPTPPAEYETQQDLDKVGEQNSDDLAVDRFAVAMKDKLAKKRDEGRGGWEDKTQYSAEWLSELLRGHVGKGDPVDVANFCMMLHQRGESITLGTVVSAQSDPAMAGDDLPIMRTTFRVTELSGHPNPKKRQFNMVFKFRTMEDMHAADDEWLAFIARRVQPASGDGAVTAMVHAMFRSGNNIPVTRITITREQYDQAIGNALKANPKAYRKSALRYPIEWRSK